MKSTKNLRLRLRLMEGALLLLLGVCTTAAVSTHQLLLDAANHPASDFNLASTHVVGTLDDLRLSANIARLDGGGSDLQFTTPVYIPSLSTGSLSVSNGISTDAGGFIDNSNNLNVASIISDGGGVSSNGSGSLLLNGGLSVNGTATLDGGAIYTDGTGGLTTVGLLVGEQAEIQGDLTVSHSAAIVGGIGLFGVTPPASQPATPTNQAEIIAVLQAYGLCQ